MFAFVVSYAMPFIVFSSLKWESRLDIWIFGGRTERRVQFSEGGQTALEWNYDTVVKRS